MPRPAPLGLWRRPDPRLATGAADTGAADDGPSGIALAGATPGGMALGFAALDPVRAPGWGAMASSLPAPTILGTVNRPSWVCQPRPCAMMAAGWLAPAALTPAATGAFVF